MSLPIKSKKLDVPPLKEIRTVLQEGLKIHFEEVNVAVVDCPDLTQEPFTLANKGLNGNTKLVEVGGPPYLLPVVNREKVYDLKEIARIINANPAFLVGAGAGPHPHIGCNCEGIINLSLKNGTVVEQKTRISKVIRKNEKNTSVQETLPSTETRFALLANLFVSEGKAGKVLKVHVKKRIGSKDFIASIRECLEKQYKEKLVGLGGTFLLKTGKAKQHVMPDFSKTPITTEEQLNNWLTFYNMSAPLIALGTLVSREDEALDLRVQHFHSFSHHGEAGHYHIDVTPDEVEYLGYFNTGDELYRIDAPKVTHTFGRD